MYLIKSLSKKLSFMCDCIITKLFIHVQFKLVLTKNMNILLLSSYILIKSKFFVAFLDKIKSKKPFKVLTLQSLD